MKLKTGIKKKSAWGKGISALTFKRYYLFIYLFKFKNIPGHCQCWKKRFKTKAKLLSLQELLTGTKYWHLLFRQSLVWGFNFSPPEGCVDTHPYQLASSLLLDQPHATHLFLVCLTVWVWRYKPKAPSTSQGHFLAISLLHVLRKLLPSTFIIYLDTDGLMAGGFTRDLMFKPMPCRERVTEAWVCYPKINRVSSSSTFLKRFSMRHHWDFKTGFSCSGKCENALENLLCCSQRQPIPAGRDHHPGVFREGAAQGSLSRAFCKTLCCWQF